MGGTAFNGACMLRAFFCIAALSLTTACGTLSNRFAPQALTSEHLANSQNGVVLLSAGADDKCVSFATFLKVMADGSTYNQREVALLPVDVYAMKSDFDDHFGFVHAVSLPAGAYYLTPWLANPYFDAVRAPRFDFTVAAGEVVYVGEYYQPGRCSTGDGSVRDRWSRDGAMIAAKNPNIDISGVSQRVITRAGAAIPPRN